MNILAFPNLPHLLLDFFPGNNLKHLTVIEALIPARDHYEMEKYRQSALSVDFGYLYRDLFIWFSGAFMNTWEGSNRTKNKL